ncbi:MAG: toll/interleukin-1 receptor domain-containing protein [Actinobacteria bacterium]|nr:toll/interleukin-1 receptor domain-containing protein [Actinomycetota bacterium]
MRLFISHATTDLEVAEALKLRFEEIPGLSCALLATDIAPGDDWEVRIRRAARECDAIACLVTPEYIKRPWFYAEWAAFWFQEDKTWFLLMLDTSLDDVFEVMRRRQSAFLNDRRSVEGLLTALASGDLPDRGIDLLSDETVRAVAGARARTARAQAEADLARLATRLRSGEDNVSPEVVERLLAAGRNEEIIRLARDSSSNGPTKRRQLAVCLIDRGQAQAAAAFDELITNNAERRTVGIACLDRLARRSDDDAVALVMKIYTAVREPQRRELRNHAAAIGITIGWPEVDPNP